MKYKFEDSSLMVGYIKELLHNFNLPMTEVYTEDTIPYDGRIYIKNNKYVLYTNGNFKEVGEYDYNRPALNLTTTLPITSSVYDTFTHRYLGRYLRFLRDYHKVDLMGMYNCFCNQQPSRITRKIKINDSYKLNLDSRSDTYNLYIVPVKFNKEYTIAIDSPVPFEIVCTIWTNNFLQENNSKAESNYDKLVRASYRKINSSTYKKPFIYSTKINNNIINAGKELWHHEKSLYMLFKLPAVVESSITVLEGRFETDVIDNTIITDYIINEPECDRTQSYMSTYPTRNSLLEYNSKKSYPFADRLIEYLIGNVNSPLDNISTNTLRTQMAIYGLDGFKGYVGVWDDILRYYTYKYANKQDISKGNYVNKSNKIIEYTDTSEQIIQKIKKFNDNYQDLNYYIDKDLETLLRLGGLYGNY